jgi:hypothetical protein
VRHPAPTELRRQCNAFRRFRQQRRHRFSNRHLRSPSRVASLDGANAMTSTRRGSTCPPQASALPANSLDTHARMCRLPYDDLPSSLTLCEGALSAPRLVRHGIQRCELQDSESEVAYDATRNDGRLRSAGASSGVFDRRARRAAQLRRSRRAFCRARPFAPTGVLNEVANECR